MLLLTTFGFSVPLSIQWGVIVNFENFHTKWLFSLFFSKSYLVSLNALPIQHTSETKEPSGAN